MEPPGNSVSYVIACRNSREVNYVQCGMPVLEREVARLLTHGNASGTPNVSVLAELKEGNDVIEVTVKGFESVRPENYKMKALEKVIDIIDLYVGPTAPVRVIEESGQYCTLERITDGHVSISMFCLSIHGPDTHPAVAA